MKRTLILSFLFLLSMTPFLGHASCWTLEVGPSFYHPHRALTKAYSGGWIDYQLEGSKILNENVELWAGVNWISKRQKNDDYSDSYFDEKKQIWILPVSIGAKYYYYFTPCLSAYIGGGAVCTFLRMEYHTYHFHHDSSKQALGAIIKSGVRFDWGNYTFLNFFADYYHQTFHLSHSQREISINRKIMDLSAFKVGCTIGVYF